MISSMNKDKEYWLPSDKFILKVIEKYGCLAMISPRIQSPYDLVRWDRIKEDPILKFKLTKNIKQFYLSYLEQDSLMDHRHFYVDKSNNHTGFDIEEILENKGSEFGEETYRKMFIPPPSDIELMWHEPVFGHWLKESGFINESMMKNEKEYNYQDYIRIFDLNEADAPTKTRNYLYPSFEAFYSTELTKKDKECVGMGIHPRLIQNLFDLGTGKFSNENFIMIDTFEIEQGKIKASKIDENVNLRGASFLNYVHVIKTDVSDDPQPALFLFNDQSFQYDKDRGAGFLYTPIQIAYHMGFDLGSKFDLINDKKFNNSKEIKSSEDMDLITKEIHGLGLRSIDSKIKKYPGSIERSFFGEGNVHIPDDDRLIFNDQRVIQKRKTEDFVSELFQITRDLRANEEIWKKFPRFHGNAEIVTKDHSCYNSFSDYQFYNDKIEAITGKDKVNYFWFMYGCLPVNKISYEDLKKGLSMKSTLKFTDTQSKWRTEDIQEIFNEEGDENNGLEWYERSILPIETNMHEVLRLNLQTIKFLGLIFGMDTRNLDEDFFKIKMYYICNTSKNVMHKVVKATVLDRVYPLIGSAKYGKKSKEDMPTVEIKPQLISPKNPTSIDKDQVIAIRLKIRQENDLNARDFRFLRERGLLSSEAAVMYESLAPDFKKDDPDYENFIKDIVKNEKILDEYAAMPSTDINDIVIPNEIKALDEKLKFPTKDQTAILNEQVKDNVRSIMYYIFDSGISVISYRMLRYLELWRVLEEGLVDKLVFIDKGGDKKYYSNFESDEYKKIKEYLFDKNTDGDAFFTEKESRKFNDKFIRSDIPTPGGAKQEKDQSGKQPAKPEGKPQGGGQQNQQQGQQNQQQGEQGGGGGKRRNRRR